jgi:hypothetical protein
MALTAKLSIGRHDAREEQQSENGPLKNLPEYRREFALGNTLLMHCLFGHDKPPFCQVASE